MLPYSTSVVRVQGDVLGIVRRFLTKGPSGRGRRRVSGGGRSESKVPGCLLGFYEGQE